MGHRPEHETPQDPTHAGHGATHGECGDDGAVHVDPHEGRDLLVFGDGPHGLAGLGALDDVPESDHRGRGHRQHQQAGSSDLERQDRPLLGQPLREAGVALGGRTEQAEHEVLNEKRHTD